MPIFGGGKKDAKKEKKSKSIGHIEEILDDADKLLQGGDIDKAAAEYRRAHRTLYKEENLNADPLEFSKVFTRTGHGLFETEEIDRSIECFEKAAQLDPKNVDAWLSKGIAHLKTKQMLNYAVLCFNEVIKLKPNSEEAWENKAETLVLDDKKSEAIECYEKLIQLNPGSERYRKKLDELSPMTVEALNDKLAAEPDNVELLTKKASILVRDDKHAEAAEVYSKLSDLSPKDPAWAKKVLEVQPDNITAINRLLALTPKDVDLLKAKASALLAKRRNADAIECFATLGELEPGNTEHFYKMLELNPHNVVAMEKVIALEPSNLELQERLASELVEMGRKDDAIAAYERLVAAAPDEEKYAAVLKRLKPDEKDVLEKKAIELVALGEKERALEIYTTLIGMDSSNPRYEEMARKLRPVPRPEQAPAPKPEPAATPRPAVAPPATAPPKPSPAGDEMASIDEALKRNPQDKAAILRKAKLLEQRGDKEMAAKNYQRLVAMEPANFEYMDLALKLKPDDVALLTAKGDAAYEGGDFARALEAFDRLSTLQPTDENNWHNKGAVLYNMERFAEAVECFDKVLSMNQDDTVAWLTKGVCQYKMGKYEDAVTSLNNVVKRDMNEAAAWFYKSAAEARRGNAKPVIAFLKRAIDLDASYKETAAGDEAFAQMKSDPAFQGLVK
jgi:tetratricopeptide (TPR) repeat protein